MGEGLFGYGGKDCISAKRVIRYKNLQYRQHFQQFGGVLAFVFVDFQTDFSVCFADGKTVNIFNGKQGVYKTDIAVNVGYWNRQFPAVKRHR